MPKIYFVVLFLLVIKPSCASDLKSNTTNPNSTSYSSSDANVQQCANITVYDPNSPAIPCTLLYVFFFYSFKFCYLLTAFTRPTQFILCSVQDLFSMPSNEYSPDMVHCTLFFLLHNFYAYFVLQIGCRTYGTGEVTTATCEVLDGITCFGPTQFNQTNFPCIRYDSVSLWFVVLLILFMYLGTVVTFFQQHLCIPYFLVFWE